MKSAFIESLIYYLKLIYDSTVESLKGIDWQTIIQFLGRVEVLVGIVITLILLVFWLSLRYFRTPHIESGTDNPRQLVLAAKAWYRKGEYLLAADLYKNAKKYNDAAECFLKANAPLKAAEMYMKLNDIPNAALNFERSKQYERAANLFLRVNMYKNAAENFEKTGNLKLSAELYERAGDFEKAGEFYNRIGLYRKAADMFRNAGSWEKAGIVIENLINNLSTVPFEKDSAPGATVRNLAQQGAEYFKKSGKGDKAAELFLRAGLSLNSAQLYESCGNYKQAAELYAKAGDFLNAAQAYERAGMLRESQLSRAKHYMQKGEVLESARIFENLGDFKSAAEVYEGLNNYKRAAELYFKTGEFVKSAQLFEKGNDLSSAAVSYEKAGDFVRAAELYSKDGNLQKEIEMLKNTDKHLLLAQKYREQGLNERVIEVLQKIQRSSADYLEACRILADVFREKGEISLSVIKYREAIAGKPLSENNIDCYYNLAVMLEKSGESKEALQIYEDILKLQYHYKDVAHRARSLKERMTPVPESAPRPTGEELYAQTRFVVKEKPVSKKKYEILGELGRGAMGIVYKARDTILQREVALKILPKFLDNPKATENFLKEARAAAGLNHPNIVTIYEAGEEEGDLFIAMEYIEGSNVKQLLIGKKPIALSGVLFISAQLCKGLAYAHENKIIHRDIKPTNIMWTPKKLVKILDFGLAKVVQEMASSVTIVGGTPFYMSPEQTLGETLDHRTDIYSLGVTMFEMATGVLPFTKGDVGYQHVHKPPPDPREINKNIPAALSSVILKCLEKNPSERYNSAYEIFDSLKAIKG